MILKKDSQNGYLTFYLDKEKQEKLTTLHKQVNDKELIKREYYKIYYNCTKIG